jgi:hypothetical protein
MVLFYKFPFLSCIERDQVGRLEAHVENNHTGFHRNYKRLCGNWVRLQGLLHGVHSEKKRMPKKQLKGHTVDCLKDKQDV